MRTKLIWLTALPFLQTTLAKSCKCTYGEPCWPTNAQFEQLQSQLSQPLLHPTPPEAACYPPSDPSGNCTAVQALAQNGDWRSDQPGSTQFQNFETYTFPNGTISACYLNASLGFPCEQGSVSPIGVDARTVEDVQATLKFAVDYNIKLVIKNTGHDYFGRSVARGSLMLWTHNLQNMTFNASFVPQGASLSETYSAITIGAGVPWDAAYDFIQAQDLFVVGGACESVGAAGGWVTGGGHSAFSPQYGLGVDNVLEFQIVTSSGDFLTANSYQNEDLFWALRGGGGGTFGVVISVTYRTWPSIPVIGINLQANFTEDVATDVIAQFVNTSILLADAGWGGYAIFNPTNLEIQYMAPNISNASAAEIISPFFAFVGNKTRDLLTSTVPYDSQYAWYGTFAGFGVGINTELSSRLLPRAVISHNLTTAVESLLSINDTITWCQVAGGAVSKVDPDSTGLNPAWRDAASHIRVEPTWPDGASLSDITEVRNHLKAVLNTFKSVCGPDSGAYFNEASLYESNPRQTFFGSHYTKLEEIKEAYDPNHLFIVAEGVESEKWDENLLCLL